MYKIKESIIVEGVYDKIRLSGFIDGIIVAVGGFSVFTNEKKQASIKTLAEKTGIVILTDADAAGFKIRNFIKQLVPAEQVKHAYIPDIHGKEKRKRIPGKEGLIGVEGVSDDILIKALRDAGCELNGSTALKKRERLITKADMYALGLSGAQGSDLRRTRLAEELGLPSKISSNMLLDVINRLMTYEELCEICRKIF